MHCLGQQLQVAVGSEVGRPAAKGSGGSATGGRSKAAPPTSPSGETTVPHQVGVGPSDSSSEARSPTNISGQHRSVGGSGAKACVRSGCISKRSADQRTQGARWRSGRRHLSGAPPEKRHTPQRSCTLEALGSRDAAPQPPRAPSVAQPLPATSPEHSVATWGLCGSSVCGVGVCVSAPSKGAHT